MYALAIIRYRRPLEEVMKVTDLHRAYLHGLHEKGLLLVAGPLDPRYGGALILRVPDVPTLDTIRDEDPYVTSGVAQYELLPWAVATGKDSLDKL
jgi:uncharacterized protein YciI